MVLSAPKHGAPAALFPNVGSSERLQMKVQCEAAQAAATFFPFRPGLLST
jgi:hypothetical protein